MKRPFRRSLRFRLLLLSLTLLAIPWAGYQYLKETESFLRTAQEQILLGRAETLASQLNSEARQFLNESNRSAGHTLSNVLYVHPLKQPVQLDGYPEEWHALWQQRRRFQASESKRDAIAFELLTGSSGNSLYLLVQVDDSDLVYAKSDQDPSSGDHLLLALPGSEGKTRRYVIGSQAPGWVVTRSLDKQATATRIRGEWQENDRGYTVELRLPLDLTEGALSLAVVDRDASDRQEIVGIASTSGLRQRENLSLLLIPSPAINQLLQQQSSKMDTRTRIINRQRLVLGLSGNLQSTGATRGIHSWLNLLLFPTEEFHDKRENLGRLDGPEVRSAIKGTSATYRYHDRESGINILAAAQPIRHEGLISGAVIMEQTTEEVLSLQQSALSRLLQISLILFLITSMTLLLFASRLTSRITRLSRKINITVSGEGRIKRVISAEDHDDEIGDLDRSFASVMQRLHEYNHYLEAMASRLAHELRTPLAMVKTSLDNLAQDDDPAARTRYLARATEGTERLSNLLDRMREATRLEQSLESVEREQLDLTELIKNYLEHVHGIYPDICFKYHMPERPVNVFAAPELIIQALEKLIANAVDFHTKGTEIEIAVTAHTALYCNIEVSNQGPNLPSSMEHQLFNSMVSMRNRSDEQPHLGLGLYLVRLIAEYHQGRATAENRNAGVCFCIQLPIEGSK